MTIAFSEQQTPDVVSALSTQPFTVFANDSTTLEPIDPTGLTPEFQLVNGGLPPRAQPTDSPNLPQSTGWVAGNFATTETNLTLATIEVGPDGPFDGPPRGRFAVWIKVGDQVQPVGQIWVK